MSECRNRAVCMINITPLWGVIFQYGMKYACLLLAYAAISLPAFCKDSSDSFISLLYRSFCDFSFVPAFSFCREVLPVLEASATEWKIANAFTDLAYSMFSAFVKVVILPCPSK